MKQIRNSSAMPIHKLPDCTDWLTNIRTFRQLIYKQKGIYTAAFVNCILNSYHDVN